MIRERRERDHAIILQFTQDQHSNLLEYLESDQARQGSETFTELLEAFKNESAIVDMVTRTPHEKLVSVSDAGYELLRDLVIERYQYLAEQFGLFIPIRLELEEKWWQDD